MKKTECTIQWSSNCTYRKSKLITQFVVVINLLVHRNSGATPVTLVYVKKTNKKKKQMSSLLILIIHHTPKKQKKGEKKNTDPMYWRTTVNLSRKQGGLFCPGHGFVLVILIYDQVFYSHHCFAATISNSLNRFHRTAGSNK